MQLSIQGQCGHCWSFHQGPCPRVAAIEYYENGMVKRVEYVDTRDRRPLNPVTW